MDRLHILEQWIASNMSANRVKQWLDTGTIFNPDALAAMKSRLEQHSAHCAKLENEHLWLASFRYWTADERNSIPGKDL